MLRRSKASAGPRKAFTLIELALVISFCVLLTAVLAPFVGMVRQRAHAIECGDHLRRLSLGLHAFAANNNDRFPTKLEVLYPNYVGDEKAFDCPATKTVGTPDHPDYEYVGNLKESSPPSDVIVYDRDGNHGRRGKNLLRISGAVEWVRAREGKPR